MGEQGVFQVAGERMWEFGIVGRTWDKQGR